MSQQSKVWWKSDRLGEDCVSFGREKIQNGKQSSLNTNDIKRLDTAGLKQILDALVDDKSCDAIKAAFGVRDGLEMWELVCTEWLNMPNDMRQMLKEYEEVIPSLVTSTMFGDIKLKSVVPTWQLVDDVVRVVDAHAVKPRDDAVVPSSRPKRPRLDGTYIA
jgi:hypothetical protein